MIPIRINKIYGVEYYSDIYFKYEDPRQYCVLSDTTLPYFGLEKRIEKICDCLYIIHHHGALHKLFNDQ